MQTATCFGNAAFIPTGHYIESMEMHSHMQMSTCSEMLSLFQLCIFYVNVFKCVCVEYMCICLCYDIVSYR